MRARKPLAKQLNSPVNAGQIRFLANNSLCTREVFEHPRIKGGLVPELMCLKKLDV
jgi:hypothetical protein